MNSPGAGSALKLLEHTVPLDAARDDDGGRDLEALVGEVDLLCRLYALELVDLKWVPIDSANGRGMRRVSAGADTKSKRSGVAAHASGVTALPLRPSHSLMMPSAV